MGIMVHLSWGQGNENSLSWYPGQESKQEIKAVRQREKTRPSYKVTTLHGFISHTVGRAEVISCFQLAA